MLGLGAAWLLAGCATQKDTSRTLSIAGTAAVVAGATMASDTRCYDGGFAVGGGGNLNCAPSLGRGARQAGTAIAVAGAGLAAAGYALEPKGPDARKRSARSTPAPAYVRPRLVRREPDPTPAPELAPPAVQTPPTAETPAGEAATGEPSDRCRPAGSTPGLAAPVGDGATCPPPPPARPSDAAPSAPRLLG